MKLFVAHQLIPTSALVVIDNGVGPAAYGTEESIVDYALLAADQNAALPSQVSFLIMKNNHLISEPSNSVTEFQFTICSSAFPPSARLTSTHFFQLLRNATHPWITLFMTVEIDGNSTFKLSVRNQIIVCNVNLI